MRPEDVDLLLDRLWCDDPERAQALAVEMVTATGCSDTAIAAA